MDSPMSITKEVRHYVVRNVVATLGMSMYVIIDTLFISIAAGALGFFKAKAERTRDTPPI